MDKVRVDVVTEKIGSLYASVIVASKRARQINNYYHHIGEGSFDTFPPPMIDVDSKNYLTIALQEITEDKIKFHYEDD